MGKKALVSALAAALAATAAHAASECCSTCIGKSGGTYTYDPAVYDQCEPVGGICCFGCDSLGSPVFGDAVSYASDGVTAVAKTGVYITFTWANAVNVTYVALKSGQKKTVTPSYSDSLATDDDGTFKICPSSTGTIYFRGWGSDPCTESSVEQNVTIEAGDSSTCDGSSTTDSDTEKSTSTASGSASASGSAGSSSANVESCNANRGSIQEVDGVKTCVCVSDWTNPPECDQWPVWKWIVTIGGGVAAFFSILLSIRAFIKSREKKDADKRDSADPPILQKDVDTLQVTPSREHKHEPLAMPVAYKRDSDIDYLPPSNAQQQPAAQKDHREFAL